MTAPNISKVALCIDGSKLGGIETHVMLLCHELTKNGYNCQIFFLNNLNNNPLFNLCNQKNLCFHRSPTIKNFLTKLKDFSPDIVHSHGYKANIISRLYALFSMKRTIATYHAGEKTQGKLYYYTLLDRFSSFLSKNIAVNEVIAKTLPFNRRVIANFINTPPINPTYASSHKPKLYFIGRVSPEKGPEHFCKLSTYLKGNYEFHMVGDGPLLQQCQQQYQHVNFHGQLTDMQAVWHNADMLCITSHYEGLPLVLLESLSQTIPVVSFDVGTINKVIPEMTVAANDINALAKKIDNWFTQSRQQQYNYLSQVYNLIKKHYSTETLVPQIIKCYLEIKQ